MRATTVWRSELGVLAPPRWRFSLVWAIALLLTLMLLPLGLAPAPTAGQAKKAVPDNAVSALPAPSEAPVASAVGMAAPSLSAAPGVVTPKRWWHWRIASGPGTTERWVASSPKDTTYIGGGLAPRPADPADWGARRFMVEGRAFTFEELQRLPTDTSGMSAFLWQPYNTGAFTPRVFGEALDLAIAPVSPAVRAAAYRAIAARPEVQYAGTLKDGLGREGIGLIYNTGGTQYQLIVDRTTGAALGDRALGAGPSAVTFSNTVAVAEWTDSPPSAGQTTKTK